MKDDEKKRRLKLNICKNVENNVQYIIGETTF